MSDQTDAAKSIISEVLSVIREEVQERKREKSDRQLAAEEEKARVAGGEQSLDLLLAAAKFDRRYYPDEPAWKRIDISGIVKTDKDARQRADELVKLVKPHFAKTGRLPALSQSPPLKAATKLDAAARYALVVTLLQRLDHRGEDDTTDDYNRRNSSGLLAGRLLTSDTVTGTKQLDDLMALAAVYIGCVGCGAKTFGKALAEIVAWQVAAGHFSEFANACVEHVCEVCVFDGSRDARRIAIELRRAAKPAGGVPLDERMPWAKKVIDEIVGMDEANRIAWGALITHAQTAKGAKPGKRWLAEGERLLQPVNDEFSTAMRRWCGWVLEHKPDDWPFSPSANEDAFKGLLWLCTANGVVPPYSAVANIAEFGYRKVAYHGPVAPTIANAAILVLCHSPDLDGIGYLSALTKRIKYANGKHVVQQRLDAAAKLRGMGRDDLEELAVPDFGLSHDGTLEIEFGSHVATIQVADDSKTSLCWKAVDGKAQKSIPTAIKRDHADELKAVRKKVKDIDKIRGAIISRLEGMYLAPRSLKFSDWQKRYIDHPLAGNIAQRLVWVFSSGDNTIRGFWHANKIIDSAGTGINLDPATTTVRLWHPLDTDMAEILAWRERFDALEVTQPFKQAHREVYLITDAERATGDHSNRFAGHIIRQHQFRALCKERGWYFDLHGGFDGSDDAYREFKHLGLVASLEIEHVSSISSDAGIFLYVGTGKLEVGPELEPARLDTLDPVFLSELMRDVDLFVGVCSIAADPAWLEMNENRELYGYAERTAFGELGESAKSRRAALESILPKLNVADRVTIGQRFVTVRGNRNTYRVHIGSGNVMLEKNDQYLCIVPKSRTATADIRLPFAGDPTLSLVLSKILLLADDDKIKDKVILAQLDQAG